MVDTVYVYEGNKIVGILKFISCPSLASRNLRLLASVHLLDFQGRIRDFAKADASLGETISDPYLPRYRRYPMNVNEKKKKKIARTVKIN